MTDPDPYAVMLAKVAEAWEQATPGTLADRDQQAAEIRDKLTAFGVDLTDEAALRGMLGLLWVMNAEGTEHVERGCCPPKLAMAGECFKVASLSTLAVLSAARSH